MSSFAQIPIKSPTKEPVLQVSKWLKLQLLIEVDEMSELMKALAPFWICSTSAVSRRGEGFITPESFLEVYSEYVASLKKGLVPDEMQFKRIVPSAWTATLDALFAVAVGEEQQLIRVAKPVIQLQSHRFDYSALDGKFRSTALGKETVSWGIQFSYPQLYQDGNTREVIQLNDGDAYENTALFKKMQRWVRQHTMATPFQVEGERVNVPIRLGKGCLNWINDHPQLQQRGLKIGS
jgi:hypothetical protein